MRWYHVPIRGICDVGKHNNKKGMAMNLFFLVSRARNDVLDTEHRARNAKGLDSRFMREQRRIYADVYGR